MNIVQNREDKRRFLNLINDLLPFVNDLRVQKFADKSFLFTLREKYVEQSPYLPASFLSDGTVNIAALVIALYFEHKPILIIEEPERNIHPHLISKIVNMLEEVSEKRQIIVTTHNPEIVKHASIENLLLISRNELGFSNICRPSESKEVQLFLQNELGIAELYVQDLLGVKTE
jgi:predicted ATPase